MKDKLPESGTNLRIPPSLFADLPSELTARFAALGVIREAFEAAYDAHSQDDGAKRETSGPKLIKP
ncbi:MAG: hypothetical protein ABSB74_06420 [Tepidisphaeraceae bacterium]